MKRQCAEAEPVCETNEVCVNGWEDYEATVRPANTVDAQEAQCVEWYVAPPPPPPVPCVGEYAEWTSCSATCGGGSMTREYAITQNAEPGCADTALCPPGDACPAAHGAIQSTQCNVDISCATDCVGAWTPYGSCAASCWDGVSATPTVAQSTHFVDLRCQWHSQGWRCAY